MSPKDGQRGNNFGMVVAISGGTLVVGADHLGEDGGSAYVYIRDQDTWSLQAKLLPNDKDAQAGDKFGFSVAISGDIALIGAYLNDENGNDFGAVYVFVRDKDTWEQQAKLVPNDEGSGYWFGYSVALSGGTAVIGAWRDDDTGTDGGSAYVFTQDGDKWEEQAKLLSYGPYGRFGYSVAVSEEEDTIVVGAYRHYLSSGAAYVFTRDGDTWSEQATLRADDGQDCDNFGNAVAISGDTVVVGAYRADNSVNGVDSGSAYVFVRDRDRDGWDQQAKLLPMDGQASDYFGASVALSGDTAVVGSPLDDDNWDWSGSAYVFIRDGNEWNQEAKLLPYDGRPYDTFGNGVAVNSEHIIIGANAENSRDDGGGVYIFSRDREQ